MSSKSVSSAVLFKWLWQGYLRKHARLIAVALVFMFIEGSMLGALAYMMQPMFDNVFVGGDGDMLYVIAAVVIGIFFIRAVSGVLQKILLSRVAMLTASAVRQDLLAKMMKQGGEFHQTHPPGYLIQRVQGDVGAVARENYEPHIRRGR